MDEYRFGFQLDLQYSADSRWVTIHFTKLNPASDLLVPVSFYEESGISVSMVVVVCSKRVDLLSEKPDI